MLNRFVEGIRIFFETWRFPVFMLATLLFFNAVIVLVLVLPPASDPLSQFAADFRRWCFGEEAGSMRGELVFGYFIGPLLLGGIVVVMWRKELAAGWQKHRRASAGYSSAALVLALGVAAFLPTVGASLSAEEKASDPLAFPAEQLRMDREPPEIRLINQYEEKVDLQDFAGEIVVITSIYGCCTDTCPQIVMQAKRIVESLPGAVRADVTVLMITMNPEVDSPERLKVMADGYRIAPPEFHMLTGEPSEVNLLLNELSVRREYNEETGEIDHANIFYLVARSGEIAYRFSLGEMQERWMREALLLLAAEDAPAQ